MIDPYSSSNSFRGIFRQRSVITNLILINVAVFIGLNIIELFFWLFKMTPVMNDRPISFPVYWLSVPADLLQLMVKPWSLITYMFTHQDLFHILFNMITLYFGGKIFLSLLNEKKLISTYLIGGISGALFFILAYNIFPVFGDSVPFALAIGASASVLAILIAAATYAPDYYIFLMFIGRIKLKYIALALIIIDVLSISRSNPGGHIAHLGGAAWGFIYVRYLLNKGWKGNFSAFWPKKRTFRKKTVNRNISDEEYNARKNENQKQIDQILDKISKFGYDGLTKEEKEILFKAGKK
ncbi:MAG: rhomboid family intramembrane serine protease [Bacteroidales bacterium]